MRRLLAGDNPATAIHDGSANRQPTLVTETASTDETAAPSPSRVPAIAPTPAAEAETVEPEQTEDITAGEFAGANPRKDRDYFCRIGRRLDTVFNGEFKQRLDELSHLNPNEITPVVEDGIRGIVPILKEIANGAAGYAAQFEALLRPKNAEAA